MDAPGWTGEPGALPSDRDWERPYHDAKADAGVACADCGAGWAHGFGSANGRIFCADCRARRGFRFLFDPRSWREIAAAILEGAA